MNEERARRVGHNEALYRQVNERIEDVNEAFNVLTDRFEIVCECGDLACMEQIAVAAEIYERARSESALFLVKAGHHALDVEAVVEDHGRFVIVRKHPGVAQEIAEATDPRSR